MYYPEGIRSDLAEQVGCLSQLAICLSNGKLDLLLSIDSFSDLLAGLTDAAIG